MSFFKSLLICMSIGGIVGVIAAIVTVCTKKPGEWMPKKKTVDKEAIEAYRQYERDWDSAFNENGEYDVDDDAYNDDKDYCYNDDKDREDDDSGLPWIGI